MTLATYVFSDSDTASSARHKICDNLGGSSAAFVVSNEVSITDECRDPQKASEICRAFGGKAR